MVQPIIDEEGRKALKTYKYKSSIYSWLDTKVGTPFWEWVVTFVPLNVAPNLITFVATLIFLIAFLIFQYYAGNMEDCAPSWVYYNLAICLFIYQTLDAIDGKQARRTNQSSPLGQLFDHGNDAIATTPMVVAGLGCLKFGHNWLCLITLLAGYIVFYMLNWRARHVGCMHFGIFSVTEAQVMGMVIYAITGYFGCDIWEYPLGSFSLFDINLSLDIRSVSTVVVICAALFTSYGEYLAVQQYYLENCVPDPGRYIELLQITMFVLTFISWNLNDIFSQYPRLYIWTMCLIFSGLIHRLIVADVTHMKTKKIS